MRFQKKFFDLSNIKFLKNNSCAQQVFIFVSFVPQFVSHRSVDEVRRVPRANGNNFLFLFLFLDHKINFFNVILLKF